MIASKAERLAEIVRRLSLAPACRTMAEAMALLVETVNAVEDESTSIPYAPGRYRTDGRLYPPQADAGHDVADPDDVRRYRSARHNVLLSANGAIRIEDAEWVMHPEQAGQRWVEHRPAAPASGRATPVTFADQVSGIAPGVTVAIDEPLGPDGEWWFDIARDAVTTTVSWTPSRGFGFYPEDAGFGERPYELYLDPADALRRLRAILGC